MSATARRARDGSRRGLDRRIGQLSDETTLRLYERGVSIMALAVQEGIGPAGIAARCVRARQARRDRGVLANRKRAQQPRYTSLDQFAAALQSLNDALERIGR